MMNEPGLTLATAVLCGLLAAIVAFDSREHRIPNLLVVFVVFCGLTMQLVQHGSTGALTSLAGLCVGMLLFLPFHIGGAMGAGDVKLMGAVGSALGPLGAVLAVALTLIAGAVLTFIITRFAESRQRAAEGPSDPEADSPSRVVAVRNGAARIPYAAAIATGSVAAMWQLGYLQPLVS